MDKQEKIDVESSTELRKWLENNYGRTESVWLVKWKKDSGKPYFVYDDMVDELIAFGWVDSLPKKLDEQKSMYRISPRNPKSNWSKVNKGRVQKLLGTGRMHESGMELVKQAKKNGAWNFLDDVEKLIVPPDLDHALNSLDMAKHYYKRFPDSSKRSILEWIKNAKHPSTRQKRIEETAKKAAQNIKANHSNGRDAGSKK